MLIGGLQQDGGVLGDQHLDPRIDAATSAQRTRLIHRQPGNTKLRRRLGEQARGALVSHKSRLRKSSKTVREADDRVDPAEILPAIFSAHISNRAQSDPPAFVPSLRTLHTGVYHRNLHVIDVA